MSKSWNQYPVNPNKGSGQKWLIDGKHVTIGTVIAEAKSRGVQIDNRTLYARLKKGVTTMDALMKPPAVNRQAGSKAARQREKDEMAAVIANMAPRQRY